MKAEQRPVKASQANQAMKRDPSKTTPVHHRSRDERLNVIADLLAQGLTMAETSRRVGLSAGWVTQIARARGLTGCSPAGEPPLDRRQLRMLAFIRDYTARNSFPPTVRGIVKGCSLSSNSVAQYNLQVLEHRKYATRIPGAARGMALTERGRSLPVAPPDSPAREEEA